MAFHYVHICNEIQHIDIEPYKYILKLQIYISNRIHTIRNYTYVHPYCMHVRRTAYIYIEVTHLYIEPNTYTSKLHIYTSNQIHIHRNYTYINGTVQINRNAFVHIEIIRLYFELFTCVRRDCLLIWSIEPWKLLYKSKLWATGQRLHRQGLETRTLAGDEKRCRRETSLTDHRLEQFFRYLRDLLRLVFTSDRVGVKSGVVIAPMT